MKGIILYKGKYGATAQYAEWLAKELNIKMGDLENSQHEIPSCDFIILGSSVYIGKLQVSQWLKTNAALIQDKAIFLFVVCGTPSDKKEKLESYIQSSVPAAIRSQCRIYFLPGRLIYKKLSLKDKFMLRMGALLMGGEAKKTMLTDYDNVRKENLDELMSAVRKSLGKPEMLSEAVLR